MQDAFLVALERGIGARADTTAAAWLRTTVRNLYVGDLRAAARRPKWTAIDPAVLDASWRDHDDRYADYLEALRR